MNSTKNNVFADLELPNPQERLVKAEIALKINTLIKERKLTQIQAAHLLNISRPKISLLLNGKLGGFSLSKLFKLLNLLGYDVTINISAAQDPDKAQLIVWKT